MYDSCQSQLVKLRYAVQLLVVSYDGLCMTVVAHDNISLKESRIGLGTVVGWGLVIEET